MHSFPFLRHRSQKQTLVLATLIGLLVISVFAVAADENGDRQPRATADDQPIVQPGPDENWPPREMEPTRDSNRFPQRSPRFNGQPRDVNRNQPGPFSGNGGPPRQPDRFGPGSNPQTQRPSPQAPFQRRPQPPMRPSPWDSIQQADPEIFKLSETERVLDRRTRELADNYLDASEDERTEVKEELDKLVTEHFEARQQRRKLELEFFEAELKRLREALESREKNRSQIIADRVSELIEEKEEPGF